MIAQALAEMILLLAAIGAVGWVAHRLRFSPVLGFLAAGILIGPHGMGRLAEAWPPAAHLVIENHGAVHVAAELGVAFLLFMIGLELSPMRLWRMRAQVFGLGGAQVLCSAAAIAAIAMAFGNPAPAALVLGAALALSSTAIVVQLLTEAGRLGSPAGQSAFAVLLFQDLAVVPLLFLVGVLAAGAQAGAVELAAGVGLAMGKAAAAILLILLAGRLMVRPLLRAVAATHGREAFLASVLLAILGIALATEAAGLSLALGAFLAGLLLAETEYRHQITVDVEPFKGLLLGVFFLTVGLSLDVAALAADPFWILASAVGLIALKAAILALLALLAGASRAVAAEVGLLLGQGGEFAFIVLGMAGAQGLIPPATVQFMALTVGISMLATPPLAVLARRLAQRLEPPSGEAMLPAAGEMPQGHVIIAGYGRVGRMVGELLDAQRLPHVALDRDIARVRRCRGEGAAVFYGDAAQVELLARLGAARAAALVITMDRPDAALAVVAAARQQWPELPIYARVRDAAHARALLAAGATRVVLEVTEASLQLGEAALAAAGVPDEAARALIAERREALRSGLLAEPPPARRDDDQS